MLTIRKEQMEALAPVMLKSFECRVYAHLLRVFERQCNELGEPVVRERIRQGITGAGEYGITLEYDVVRYIDLMFILSEDFDSNTELPWTARILKAKSMHGTDKMDRLYERLDKELDAVSGA